MFEKLLPLGVQQAFQKREIVGGSRGIGKAIALKVAKDGANVVIAAKTTQKHPKLEGTIYSAAEEVEAIGGKCLPIQCDLRDEEAVKAALDKAVQHFGGLDVLVNATVRHVRSVETFLHNIQLNYHYLRPSEPFPPSLRLYHSVGEALLHTIGV